MAINLDKLRTKLIDYQLHSLLAVLLGDGGHYECKHGTNKAVQKAMDQHHLKWEIMDTYKALVKELGSMCEFDSSQVKILRKRLKRLIDKL